MERKTGLSATVKEPAKKRRSQLMKATSTMSPYLDYTRAEEYTTLHRITLWRAVKAGRLKASGYGRAVRFHVKDLDEFMNSRNRK
jgi:excisionase family DNA binding protein